MGLYLVDYENVHDAGLEGVGRLTSQDKVVIFYGIKIKAVPFERHIEIMGSKANVEYIKTDKVAKNYLDFQLSTYLGYIIGTGEKGPVRIISKDTGFDSLVDYWKDRNINIKRQLTISSDKSSNKTEAKKTGTPKTSVAKTQKEKVAKKEENPVKAVPESYRKKIRTAVKKENLQASKYTAIYNAMGKSINHNEYKQSILGIFGPEQGESVYNHTQNIFGELINNKKSGE